MMERVHGVRYAVPLREGGSLPAVVDTDRLGPYVVKFRGAGQGAKALVAEAIVAGLALTLGLPVPDPAIVLLDAEFGTSEPDPEIQDILRGSVGPNFGLAYLPGALAFDPAVDTWVAPDLAAAIVWLDALTTNVDRTARNVNLLVWCERLWLIDHGAALYFHHRWEGWEERMHSRFPQIREHVLLGLAGDIEAADERLRPLLTEEALRAVVAAVPDEWLCDEPAFPDLDAHRAAYVTYLAERLNGPRDWLREAVEARKRGPVSYVPRTTHRVV
ncbi:MAG: aminotransferase class I and II [Sphaerobacter sp.]|nr:aminotransferase class I and II [Sphaerobacter sp.]